VKPATHYPRASEHVEDMIRVAQGLIDAGYAYVKHGSVYFDISKLPSYGRLSNVDLKSIDVGRTVDLDDYEKDSPVDFTLFKRVTLDELKRGIGFETAWGQARPGWHIECVAMAMRYLGDFFDIHTSGCDLIFPHHENEIAMAMALTERPLARTWLHSEMMLIDGKKMSRSAGNVVTLRDLAAQGYTGRQIRFFLLRTSYRKPLNFSLDQLNEAARGLKRIDQFVGELQSIGATGGAGEVTGEVREKVGLMEADFAAAMNDDLNASRALAALYSLIKHTNPMIAAGDLNREEAREILAALGHIDRILGVLDIGSVGPELSQEIRDLISQREEARESSDWDQADLIRRRLLERGVEIVDTPQGARWRWLGGE
jgi:cysteinyl-tRNA synthetase